MLVIRHDPICMTGTPPVSATLSSSRTGSVPLDIRSVNAPDNTFWVDIPAEVPDGVYDLLFDTLCGCTKTQVALKRCDTLSHCAAHTPTTDHTAKPQASACKPPCQ